MCLGRARRRRLSLLLRPRRLLLAFGPRTPAPERPWAVHGPRCSVRQPRTHVPPPDGPGKRGRGRRGPGKHPTGWVCAPRTPLRGLGGVVWEPPPRGSLCKWVYPAAYCLCPLGESRRRCVGAASVGALLTEWRLPGLALHLLSWGGRVWRAPSPERRLCNYGRARVSAVV